MKNLLLIPMFLIAITMAPFGDAFANEAASGNITSDTTYTIIDWKQPAHYKFVPSKSITAYELAQILEKAGLTFYLEEDEYKNFPSKLKKYLKKEQN